jgi:anti-sigma regulatory factor (Ser/Thr protein kinase)
MSVSATATTPTQPDMITRQQHSWPADPGVAHVIRDTVHRWLTALPLTSSDAASMVVAVDAAVENATRHAYQPEQQGTVEVSCWTEAGSVCVEVADHGRWRPQNPSGRPGRGIPLMERLVAAVAVQPDEPGTRVLLRHPLTV